MAGPEISRTRFAWIGRFVLGERPFFNRSADLDPRRSGFGGKRRFRNSCGALRVPRRLRSHPSPLAFGSPRASLAALSVLFLVACPGPTNPYIPFAEPSYDEFVAQVQPVVARHCAHLGCHGTFERTLTLYAIDFLRAPPSFAGTPLDEHRLSPEELAWNYDSLRVRIAHDEPLGESRLLLKCLPPAEGGIVHAGTAIVFPSRQDPDFRAFETWIGGGR